MTLPDWLHVTRGTAPLIVSIPHAGLDIPPDIETRLADPWLARRDADWWVPELYAFAADLGASVIRTRISRTVIDVNRDPTGASLYPGQATTGLCPDTSFDGEPLYRPGQAPDPGEVAARRNTWFEPYHAALTGEIARLRQAHPAAVLYDAHSIRSRVPRLFEGELPQFNIGANGGLSCDGRLTGAIAAACRASGRPTVVDGRFRGGQITRAFGQPAAGVHAIQMELACRGYMDEPAAPSPKSWPTPFDPGRAAPLRAVLTDVLAACLAFAAEATAR